MPRVLPWKRREQKAFEPPSSARSSPDSRVKQEETKPSRDEEDSVSPSNAKTTTRKKTLKRPRRSTSTSPPPEPPEEIFMIEGIDGDDRYRMVEDEFLATAQQFTAHLHAAEYKRLKTASEVENAQMIRNISRPVVGQMTHLVKTKQERKALNEKQRLAKRKLRQGDASGDESSGTDDLHDSWQKQSLHGLMESPSKRAKRLNELPIATSVTRAAAGFNKQSDVTSPSRRKSKAKTPYDASSSQNHENNHHPEDRNIYHITHRSPRLKATSSRTILSRASEVKRPLENSYKDTENVRTDQPEAAGKTAILDDDDSLDFMARLKKRREERLRIRGQRKSMNSNVKSNSDDILPDFL
ncbi:hypothetical protein F5Y07DRAFT_85281 [Xylaria sp. FL0933]|nr:hypothetical protein F5Y07DRAFT_85281 [Xylaria sp. FL0933]